MGVYEEDLKNAKRRARGEVRGYMYEEDLKNAKWRARGEVRGYKPLTLRA